MSKLETRFLLLSALFFLNACQMDSANKQNPDIRTAEEHDSLKPRNKISEKYDLQFVAKKGNAHQLLQCDKKDNILSFRLTIENKEEHLIMGTAKLIQSAFDGETIESEDGEMIFVDEYKYILDSCELIIRLDSEEMEYASVQIRNCTGKEKNSFIITEVMKRKSMKE